MSSSPIDSSTTSKSGSRLNDLAACLVLALVTAGLVYRQSQLFVIPGDPIGSRNAGRIGMADFQDVVYYPTRAVAEGVNPYDAGETPLADGSPRYRARYPVINLFPLYSPLVLMLFGAFAIPEFTTAAIAWGAFNFILLLFWARCCLKWAEVPISIGSIAWLTSFMLFTQAGRANFLGGETALPLAIGTGWALALVDRKPTYAGLALALTSFKPTFGLPLGLLLLLLGKVRVTALGWGIGFVIGIVGLGAIFSQTNDLGRFVAILKENQEVLNSDPDADAHFSAKRVDAAGAIERLLPLGNGITEIATSLVVIGLGVFAIGNTTRRHDRATAGTAMIAIGSIAITAAMYRLVYDGLLLWSAIVPLFLAPASRFPYFAQGERRLVAVLTLVPMLNALGAKSVLAFAAQVVPEPSLGLAEACWTFACTLNGLALLAALALTAICSTRLSVNREKTP